MFVQNLSFGVDLESDAAQSNYSAMRQVSNPPCSPILLSQTATPLLVSLTETTRYRS